MNGNPVATIDDSVSTDVLSEMIVRWPRLDGIDNAQHAQIVDFVAQCLAPHEEERFTLADLLKHQCAPTLATYHGKTVFHVQAALCCGAAQYFGMSDAAIHTITGNTRSSSHVKASLNLVGFLHALCLLYRVCVRAKSAGLLIIGDTHTGAAPPVVACPSLPASFIALHDILEDECRPDTATTAGNGARHSALRAALRPTPGTCTPSDLTAVHQVCNC